MGRKEKTLLITIIANVILIALRFFLADLSGSVGLAANAWHSMTDAFVTSVVFVGLMVARYGADKLKLASKKVEHILAIFVAVFIFYMGLEILSDALSGETTELRYVPFAAAGAFLTTLAAQPESIRFDVVEVYHKNGVVTRTACIENAFGE